jgi:excisionase family DNA binding protein
MASVDGGGPPPGGAPNDEFVTVAEAAFEAGVSRQTVHDWVRRGHLAAEATADGPLRIRRREFARFAGLRRAATTTHLRIATVRHWADGADAGADGPAG